MRKLLTGVVIVAALVSFEANAQHRAGDAALGAVSGAVVLGPFGAVVGALIGYTAGPGIANSWGVGPPPSHPRPPRIRQSSVAPQPRAAVKPSAPPPTAKAAEMPVENKPPPVQGFD